MERRRVEILAVTPDGKFLYVANEFDGTITTFSVDTTSGALTSGQIVLVGTAPSGMAITPDGGFLYVGLMSLLQTTVRAMWQVEGPELAPAGA